MIRPSVIPAASQQVRATEDNQYDTQDADFSSEDLIGVDWRVSGAYGVLYLLAFLTQATYQIDDCNGQDEWQCEEEPLETEIPAFDQLFHLAIRFHINLLIYRVGHQSQECENRDTIHEDRHVKNSLFQVRRLIL